ncbi:MAG: thioredoxin fold domain-containing protein [Sedimentisphaerales bacterium]|nr:thioredoxin fold domain-containing protein [Sedimentisphaerales bacterium]
MTKVMFIQLAAGLFFGGALGAAMGYFGKCTTGACPLTANPWRGAFFGATLGGVFAFSAGSTRPPKPASDGESATIHIDNAADFERYVLKAEQPVLVDFYSNSCPPCRRLAPTIDELAAQYQDRAVVCKIKVDHARELANRYGIQAIPAVLFFVNGEPVRRLVGLQPRDTYTKILDELIG